MGLLTKIFAAKAGAKVLQSMRANRAASQGQYIPATETQAAGTGLATRGNAMLDRATQIYKQNPKLVGGLAVLGAAALLTSMKRRGRTF
jgi:hypothetical protein